MDNIMKIFGGGEQLWNTIKQYAASAGVDTTRMILELYYVMKSPATPVLDKTIIVAALAYQLLPEDILKTKDLGILGLIDNVSALAFAYSRVKKRVTPEIRTQVNAMLNQWFANRHVKTVSTVNTENQGPIFNNTLQNTDDEVFHDTENQQPKQNAKPRDIPMWDDDDVVID